MVPEMRHILLYAPSPETFKELCASVRSQPWVDSEVGDRECSWKGRGLHFEIDMVDCLDMAVELLHRGYYNMVMVDCRHVPIEGVDHSRQEDGLRAFLDVLVNEEDIERRYPLRRVAVLVGYRSAGQQNTTLDGRRAGQ